MKEGIEKKPWVFYLFDKISLKKKGPLFFVNEPSQEEIAKMEKFNIVIYYNRNKNYWVKTQYFSDIRLKLAQDKLFSELCDYEVMRIFTPLIKELTLLQQKSVTKYQKIKCKRKLGEELPKYKAGGYSTDWFKQKKQQINISINRLKQKYESSN